MAAMELIVAAKVWTYWIAVPLFAGAVLAVIGTAIGYVVRVQSPKYPRR